MFVSKVTMIPCEYPVTSLDRKVIGRHQSCIRFNFRKILCHSWANGWICNGTVLNQFSILIAVVSYPVDAFIFFMKLVITQLEHNKLKNEQTSSQSDAQSKNIDKREHFVLNNIPKRNNQVIAYH